MYLQFQRLVLGTDALKKAEEENSACSDDEYSVTHSNDELDVGTDSESEDTFDVMEHSKEKFLFEDEYGDDMEHSNGDPIVVNDDSELEDVDISNSELMFEEKRTKKVKSKQQLLDA